MNDVAALTPQRTDKIGDLCDRALLKRLRIPAEVVPLDYLGTPGVTAVEAKRLRTSCPTEHW